MIRLRTGDILAEDAEALVDTVNCVGVMGRRPRFVYSREAIDILGRRSSSEIEHDRTTQLALNHQEATAMTNWDTCPAVERTPGKVSGAWVFAGTRIPLYALYENLAGGATVHEFVEWFPGVDEEQVRSVLEHEVRSLKTALAR